MADEADRANDRAMLDTELALEAVRRRAERQTAISTDAGSCANCGAITGPLIAFCDADCRDDYEARAAALRVWSRASG